MRTTPRSWNDSHGSAGDPCVKPPLEEYAARVYRFALRLTGDRHLAEDLTQETFLRAWRGRRRLRDPDATAGWLFQIAVNLWRDEIRRSGRRVNCVNSTPDDRPSGEGAPDRGVLDREDVRRAIKAMDDLPPRQRQVLYLHACEEFPIDRIAECLQISADAVKASLSLARKRMRRQLDDVFQERFPTKR